MVYGTCPAITVLIIVTLVGAMTNHLSIIRVCILSICFVVVYTLWMNVCLNVYELSSWTTTTRDMSHANHNQQHQQDHHRHTITNESRPLSAFQYWYYRYVYQVCHRSVSPRCFVVIILCVALPAIFFLSYKCHTFPSF
jgi:hypothetical protein